MPRHIHQCRFVQLLPRASNVVPAKAFKDIATKSVWQFSLRVQTTRETRNADKTTIEVNIVNSPAAKVFIDTRGGANAQPKKFNPQVRLSLTGE